MPSFAPIIRDAYLEILERPPDPGGLDHWNGRMNAGLSEADLREALLRSPEYASKNPGAVGSLRIHPANPHYFQDRSSSRAVLVASYSNIVPTAINFDYAAQVEEARANRISYCRVWTFLPFEGRNAIWPWQRSSVGGAYMGGANGNRFDLNVFNPDYFNRIADAMSRANLAGIYTQIHIFDRVGMSPGDDERWGNNPWARDNNINDLEVPNARPPADGTPDFYRFDAKPNLRAQQERYVRRLIDATIGVPSVHYEIENEHWEDDSTQWATHYAQFVKDYIAATYPETPRLVSYNSLEDDLEGLYGSPALDVINKHFGTDAEDDPEILNQYVEPRWARNKAINVDEFANGVTNSALLREMCWTILTSGGNFHIEDADPASNPYGVVENIRLFLEQSAWRFVEAAPNRGLITSGGGYCMAQVGAEYVCYFPRGGGKRLTLAPGRYNERWWNPADGGFFNVASFTHAGGERTLNPPDGRDWALQVVSQ
jgi:hypothetical protein